jgi:hypothetical protein
MTTKPPPLKSGANTIARVLGCPESAAITKLTAVVRGITFDQARMDRKLRRSIGE